MAVTLWHAGTSISGARVPASRHVPISVTGVSGLTSLTILANGVPVGSSSTAEAICDLRAVPLGGCTFTARVKTTVSSSHAKWATVVPDPKPGPGNTGCRLPEADLIPWTGYATLPAGIIEGYLFSTAPIVGAGVTVRDCIIRPTNTRSGGRAVEASSGALLEHVTIDGSLRAFGIGIGYANWTGVALDIHHVSDGVRLSSNAALINSWVHHLKRASPDAHSDCVQTTGGTGGLIQHCTLDAYNPDTGDLCNAAIMIGGETSPLVDLLIEDNWLDGGNDTVSIRSDAAGPITLRGNRYGRNHRYRPFIAPAWVTPDGDVWDDTGEPIPINRW